MYLESGAQRSLESFSYIGRRHRGLFDADQQQLLPAEHAL
jgi:hypothetical protein